MEQLHYFCRQNCVMRNTDRDSIDFTSSNIPKLFRKIFIPTLLGMISIVLFNIADGIFIGHGIGSNGLAAVNIVAPLFIVTISVGLMFGIGGSVVASIHLSKNKVKAANINLTQALIGSSSFALLFLIFLVTLGPQILRFLGCTDQLMGLAMEYLIFVAPSFIFMIFENVGLFVVRLDGSPRYAMLCSAIPSAINIILDYLFVFPFKWGMMGAGLATSIGTLVAAVMVMVYWIKYSHTLKLYRLKLSKTSIYLTFRNIGYMVKLGFSTFLGEISVAILMFVGNYVFIRYLGEDGVAAFSVACYCLPIVYMVNNAISQSAQPIISFNHGLGNHQRMRQSFILSVLLALTYGIVTLVGTKLFAGPLVSLFIERGSVAFDIAVHGMPIFALGFVFFSLNIVFVGYFQSIEKARKATIFVMLRGAVFLVAGFLILPRLFDVPGIWLVVPCSETLTFFLILLLYLLEKKKKKTGSKRGISSQIIQR